jgi:hypothetical protein
MTIEIDTLLDDTGDLAVPTRLLTGIELVQQRIRRRLRRGSGEWFLDPDGTGLPLLAWRQQKPPQISAIVARLQDEIRAVPGVIATQGFEGTHDVSAHQLTVTGTVVVGDGATTAIVVTAASVGRRNAMVFGVFFSSGNVRGALPRPSRGRP